MVYLNEKLPGTHPLDPGKRKYYLIISRGAMISAWISTNSLLMLFAQL